MIGNIASRTESAEDNWFTMRAKLNLQHRDSKFQSIFERVKFHSKKETYFIPYHTFMQ